MAVNGTQNDTPYFRCNRGLALIDRPWPSIENEYQLFFDYICCQSRCIVYR